MGAAADLATQAACRPYTDVAELLGHEKADALVVATPPETHHLVARIAAERGVHMMIETPLATTRALMDVIAEVAARAGVVVEVGENMWRRPTERLNRKALDAGLIGRVLRVSSYYEDAGHESCYHTMSRFRLYAGADVEEVRGFAHRHELDPSVTRLAPGRTAEGPYRTDVLSDETWTQAVLLFANGVVGSCTYVTNWNRPLRWAHPHFTSVEGTAGFLTMAAGDVNVLRTVADGLPATYDRKVEVKRVDGQEIPARHYYETEPIVSYDNPFGDRVLTDAGTSGPSDGIARAHQLQSLHQAIVTGSPPAYTIKEARRDQELSIAIAESARLARPLRTDQLPGETAWERDQHEAFRRRWGVDPLRAADSPGSSH